MHVTLAVPEVSIVIPVYNERPIVTDSVAGLLMRLPDIAESFEIILAENGSDDGTRDEVRELQKRYSAVRSLHLKTPDYGRALKAGILEARGKYCICDEIDLCDTDFYRSALGLLRSGRARMVVGSKLAPGSRDERPFVRNLASRVLSGMLRIGAGFRGTDTHGPKAFLLTDVVKVVKQCVVGQNLFASELVIRAERAGLDVVELPLTLREKRNPTINLVRRVPRALYNVGRLIWIFRLRDRL
jgi:glycosyltransferase involved in cell wall biosynthesis